MSLRKINSYGIVLTKEDSMMCHCNSLQELLKDFGKKSPTERGHELSLEVVQLSYGNNTVKYSTWQVFYNETEFMQRSCLFSFARLKNQKRNEKKDVKKEKKKKLQWKRASYSQHYR